MSNEQDPYYWHFRCPSTGLVTLIDMPGMVGAIPEEKAADINAGKVPMPKFPCSDCGQEHEGLLKRTKFGKK